MKKEQTSAKVYRCTRLRLYTYLFNLGYKPELTVPDARRQNYCNWLYTDTPELRKAVDSYYQGQNNTES